MGHEWVEKELDYNYKKQLCSGEQLLRRYKNIVIINLNSKQNPSKK